MKKFFIKYDPYEMKSIVIVDGKEIQKNKHCDSNLKKYLDENIHIPIQSWIDPIDRENWSGLLKTLCDMGDKEIIIEFSGRRIDYEAVKTALISQNESRQLGAKLTFCDLKDEMISDSEMKQNIDEVINLMLTERFAKIVEDSESGELIEKYKNLKETYNELDAEEFRIVFTGTYSSGKSSTINALIGKNLLPASKGTCTSKICRIVHDPNLKCFAKVKYECNSSNTDCFCKTDEEVQAKIRAVEDSVGEIVVYTDLTSLYPAGVQSGLKIVIVDTPGTDSAIGNDTEKFEDDAKRLSKKSHIELTKEVLGSKQKEMIVLISDEKVENENIVELLDIIEESAESDEGAFNDRFLFVMNMCDALSYSNEDETLENYIKKFITNIKKVPNSTRMRNIANPRVFPITSGAALAVVKEYVTKPEIQEAKTKKAELFGYYGNFCKKVYYYSCEELEKNFEKLIDQIKTQHPDYHNFCLEKHSAVSEAAKYKYAQKLDGELSVPERVLIHSGIPALREAIQDYIKSYAFPIKVRRLLECFEDILQELISLNNIEKEELENAKKAYSDAVSAREKTEEEKAWEEKRKATLVSIKAKMEGVNERIDQIKETIPEIDSIRSSFYVIKNSIVEKVAGRKEVLKNEGDQIIAEISEQIDTLLGQINDTIRDVKAKKREATNDLYNEFISYIKELEAAGLMSNGIFSLKDTVAYKKIIDKDSFKKAEEDTRDVNNPNKYHIEFGYGIGNFFSSIGRAWRTRREPDTIKETYINIYKYLSDNIQPIDMEIAKYACKLKEDYQYDIQSLKKETKDRVRCVLNLIANKDVTILKIKEQVMEYAANETTYSNQVERLKNIEKYLNSLIERIEYTQI